MKSLSASIGAIVLICLMLSACKKEEATAKVEPPKEKAKVAVVKEEPPPAPKEEEPDLVPIGSLSESKAEEVPAAKPEKRQAYSGAVEQQSSGEYVIQVSIQSSKKAANAIVKKLADDGITAYIAEVENPGELEGTFYRVRIGYFPTIASAQEFGQQVLSPLNYAGWIDKRKNDRVGTPSGDNDADGKACEEEGNV